MDFTLLNSRMPLPDASAAAKAQKRLNEIAKPVGSLGFLEDMLIKIAALTGSERIDVSKKAVLVMCADNGVAAPDIAITPVRITRVVAEMMARKQSNVCRMAKVAGADVMAYDIGMFTKSDLAGISGPHIASGTKSILSGPAMSEDEAIRALEFGILEVRRLQEQGYRLLATGEMGVGNTTTSAAMSAVLLHKSPCEVTGRGSGLSDESLKTKIGVVTRAIEKNAPDPNNAFDTLSKLGGFDIAAMCGVFLGGALYRVPVLIDGLISAVAALTAKRLCPASVSCMLASHVSAEPAGKMLLDEIGVTPVIHAGMRLGEGTGAVAMMPLIDMAAEIYTSMLTFADIGMRED